MATSFPAPSKLLEIAETQVTGRLFYDVAEISTIRPLQRRPLRKVPYTTSPTSRVFWIL